MIPFTPISNQNMAVTAAASNVKIPYGHTQVRLYNAGPSVCYIRMSTSTSSNGTVSATVNDMPFPVGYVESFTIGIQDTLSSISAGTSGLSVTSGYGA